MYSTSTMECAAGTDKIKVTPQGCKPVSEDRCASGFMAPAENVTFPKNPLETCCKCKEGESCPYCLGSECTEAEKKKYVTDKDCFEPPPTPPTPPPSEDPEEEEEEDEEEEPLWRRYLWLLFSIIGILIMSSPISPKIKIISMLVYVGGIATWIYTRDQPK